MARRCTICDHPQVEEINKALVDGKSLSEIVAQYSGITKTSLFRHKEAHLPAGLVKGREAQEIAAADGIIERLKAISAETMEIYRQVKQAEDFDLALKAIARLEKQEELRAKLLGQLAQEGTVNIVVSPQWLSLRTVILQALEPYPEARLKVAAALKEVAGNAGR